MHLDLIGGSWPRFFSIFLTINLLILHVDPSSNYKLPRTNSFNPLKRNYYYINIIKILGLQMERLRKKWMKSLPKNKMASVLVWNLNMFSASHFFYISLLPFTQQRTRFTPLLEMNFWLQLCFFNRFKFIRFGFEPNQTRSDIFSVWFGLNFRFHRFCPIHLHPYS